jgi:hypothetical protein
MAGKIEQTHTRKGTYTPHTYAHEHAHVPTNIHTQTCTHTYTLTHTQTCTHTFTLTHSHTHTHTHTPQLSASTACTTPTRRQKKGPGCLATVRLITTKKEMTPMRKIRESGPQEVVSGGGGGGSE